MSSAQEQAINQLRADISKLKKDIEMVNQRLNDTQNELFANVLVLTTSLRVMDEQTKSRAREAFASVIDGYQEAPEYLSHASDIADSIFSKRN